MTDLTRILPKFNIDVDQTNNLHSAFRDNVNRDRPDVEEEKESISIADIKVEKIEDCNGNHILNTTGETENPTNDKESEKNAVASVMTSLAAKEACNEASALQASESESQVEENGLAVIPIAPAPSQANNESTSRPTPIVPNIYQWQYQYYQ